MADTLKQEILLQLSAYGQEGCSVNELFRNLRCGKNDFVDAKNQLIKEGIISTKKEGKQKIILTLNSGFFSKLDTSFSDILRTYEITANEILKSLRRLKPLFEHIEDKNDLSWAKVTNQNVERLFHTIIGVLESISQYTMIFTLRYHIDPQAKKFDLKENQRHGFETIQRIIEKLIEQNKDEEQEIRNYLLWGTYSTFSYVL